VAPLNIEFYLSLRDSGGLDTDTDGAERPPILISIVSLMILAILCRGQSQRCQQQMAASASAVDTFFRTVVLPTLPRAGLLTVLTILINAQDLPWRYSWRHPRKRHHATDLAPHAHQLPGTNFSATSATPLLATILAALALIAVQVFPRNAPK
jgi:hypothetical protein